MTDRLTPTARLRLVEEELGRYIFGRKEEIRGALLGLVARNHVFYLSPPGAGKSYLASEISRRVRGSRFFRIDLHAFTMREELFGPVSLSAMRERDALERKIEGYLPTAHMVQLDEIWKCPPTTLNTLLSALNEREFRNGDRTLRIPLLSMIATSNELPPSDRTLDALWDRILLRYRVRPLTDPQERREATRFSLMIRAFEAEARSFAEELSVARANRYRTERAAAGADAAKAAEAEQTYKRGALAAARPERWVIDTAGELISTPERRAALERDGVPSDIRVSTDGEMLIKHMAAWLTEQKRDLYYSTFLTLDDLDELSRAALAVEIPEAVETTLYKIMDAVGGTSVRREAELRAIIGAQATIEGRSVASVADLSVLMHALWDRPEQEAEVRRAVEHETGNADAELTALRATLAEWSGRAGESLSTAEKIAFRDQMHRELKQFERVAAAFPDRLELATLLREARQFTEGYNASIFAAAATAAATPATPAVSAPDATISPAAPVLDLLLDYPDAPNPISDPESSGAPTLPSGVRWDEPVED